MQSGGIGGVGGMETYLVGAGVGEPCGVRGMRACGARAERRRDGIANVKECSMFPRDINRVAP